MKIYRNNTKRQQYKVFQAKYSIKNNYKGLLVICLEISNIMKGENYIFYFKNYTLSVYIK